MQSGVTQAWGKAGSAGLSWALTASVGMRADCGPIVIYVAKSLPRRPKPSAGRGERRTGGEDEYAAQVQETI